MFKVVALLAIVGAASAGVVAPLGYAAGLPLAYSGYPAVGLAYNPLRVNDAVSLNSQIATQNALNVNGAVSDAIKQQNQIATVNAINAHGAARNAVLGQAQQLGAVPVAYAAGVPALAHAAVPGAVVARGAVVAAGEHVNAVNDQINTQIAIQQGIVASHQGALAAAHLDAPVFV